MIPRNCGELRTRVRIQYPKIERKTALDKPEIDWIDLGNKHNSDSPRHRYCLWVGVHGRDAFILGQDCAIDMATATFRYDGRINAKCRVVKCEANGDKIYDIVSVDHIRDMKQWTEVKLKRVISG